MGVAQEKNKDPSPSYQLHQSFLADSSSPHEASHHAALLLQHGLTHTLARTQTHTHTHTQSS